MGAKQNRLEPFYLGKGNIIYITREKYDEVNRKAHERLGLSIDCYPTPTQLDMITDEQNRILSNEYGFKYISGNIKELA